MRSIRFTIAWLMIVVLVLALGLAALRNPVGFWAGLMPLLSRALLCLAVVGAVCRGGSERAWWLGFALFGWSYVGLPFGFYSYLPSLATHRFLRALAPAVGITIPPNARFPSNELEQPYFVVGHYLWALVAALIGGTLGRAIFGTPTPEPEATSPVSRASRTAGRNWWILPSALVISGAALIALATLVTAKLEPGLWAGLCYLLTWWMIGLTALGALTSRARRREFWLGASLFGAGFMILVFSRPTDNEHAPPTFIPTIRFLETLRPRLEILVSYFDADTASLAAANVRIRNALDQPVPMPFPQPTALEFVMNYVKAATRSSKGETIPIFVDPIGLSTSEKSMDSMVSNVDLEGVPLRTSLRLCLKQLNLDYVVRDGVLTITSIERLAATAPAPIDDDPFLIAGHCLIAVIAAALGGFAAPLVCGLARES